MYEDPWRLKVQYFGPGSDSGGRYDRNPCLRLRFAKNQKCAIVSFVNFYIEQLLVKGSELVGEYILRCTQNQSFFEDLTNSLLTHVIWH